MNRYEKIRIPIALVTDMDWPGALGCMLVGFINSPNIHPNARGHEHIANLICAEGI